MVPFLTDKRIKVLRISDYNTRGLEGADKSKTEFKSPWNRLVRSEGSSDKQEGSMGSFGSGHLAVYATSAISTVFYSTMDCSQNKIEAFEGVSRVMGYVDKNGDQHSDVGYYGSNGTALPIMEQLYLEPGFSRNEPGTDIYSAAFRFEGDKWKKDLVAAVMDGFFYAIVEDNLVVEAEGVEINSKTISGLMEEYHDSVDQKTRDYYYLLSNESISAEKLSMDEKDDVLVKLAIGEELCKRVAIIRWPGMKIFDKGNISSTVPFAGVCVIKGRTISELFKGLENIQHTKWELARYDDDPELQKKAEKREKELYKSIRNIFKDKLGDTATDSVDPDIGDCLPDPFSDKDNEKQSLSDEIAEVSVQKNPIPENNDNVTDDKSAEGSKVTPEPDPQPHPPYPGPVPPIPGPDPGPNPGPHPGPNPGTVSKGQIKAVPAKIRPIGRGDGTGKYRIIITPKKKITGGYAKISLAAETGKYDAHILSAKCDTKTLEHNGNMMELPDTDSEAKLAIDVEIEHKEMCSLEVRVYGK